MKDNWLHTNWRQVHLDGHMPEFPENVMANFDAKKLVSRFARAHVNYISICAKGAFGNSFYFTDAGHRHKALKRDFLMETALECRKHNIRTSAYYSLCQDEYIWQNYRQWQNIDADGNPRREEPFGVVCLNSGYGEERVLPQLEEIIEGYPVDALFLDIPFSPKSICFCEKCKAAYKNETGRKLTMSESKDDLTAFKQRITCKLLRKVHALIEKSAPEMKIIVNQSWKPVHSLEFSELSDCGVWEIHPHSAGFFMHSRAARYSRALKIPLQPITARFSGNWGDSTLKPTAQLLWESSVMLANGSGICIGDQINIDGTLHEPAWNALEETFSFIKEREPVLEGAESVKYCAILIPHKNRKKPVPAYPPLMPSVSGAHKMLIESHIQHDILGTWQIDSYNDYKVLILPEPGYYPPEVFDALELFVANGGILIAEGESLYAEGNQKMKDVFGIEIKGESPFSIGYFKPEGRIEDAFTDLMLQVRTNTYDVKPSAAETLADLYYPVSETAPGRKFRSDFGFPRNDASGYSFATVNKYKQGKAVYLGTNIFRLYWNTNHHWLRQFVAAVFGMLDPFPLFQIKAGSVIEANLMRKDDNMILNLVQYQIRLAGDPGAPGLIEDIYPLRDIECRVRADKVKSIVMEPESVPLDFRQKGTYVSFTVPYLKYINIIKIQEGR
jgi:hypothetical protein